MPKCLPSPVNASRSGAGFGTSLGEGNCFSPTEVSHGTQIFEEGIRGRQARNEKAQNRYLEERPLRPNGQEPQAGDRDRPVGGEGQGQESAEESFDKARGGFEKDGEEIEEGEESEESEESEEVEAVTLVMAGLDPAIHDLLLLPRKASRSVQTCTGSVKNVDGRVKPTAVRFMLIPSLA
jgi:hypothetical protein